MTPMRTVRARVANDGHIIRSRYTAAMMHAYSQSQIQNVIYSPWTIVFSYEYGSLARNIKKQKFNSVIKSSTKVQQKRVHFGVG